MHQVIDNEKDYLAFKFTGTVSETEYQEILQLMRDKFKESDHIDLLMDMSDLDRFTLGTLWEDLKFDIQHFRDIRRFAVIGNTEIQKIISSLSGPFVSDEAKFFQKSDEDEALRWVH